MKKHIFGLTIFGLIVGAAAIFYAMFNVGKVEEVFVITNNQNYPMPKSCWKMKQDSGRSNDNSITVKQATLNLQTNEFNWELSTPEIDAMIALHFFLKDGGKTHYLTTETVYDKLSRKVYLEKLYEKLYPDKRLTKGNLIDNLYVIADSNLQPETQDKNYQPKFDAVKATAVLIDYSQVCFLPLK